MLENKKGGMMGILLVVGGLFFLVMFGLMLAIGSSTINWIMDETVPELNNLGEVGTWNSTDTIRMTILPVNTFIQNFTWVSGVLYIFGMIAIFGMAFAFRGTSDKWLIALFFSLILILIIGCIFMSNIYENIYSTDDDFGSIVKEHVILSYLVMYSPGIMSLIAFIAGIILFSGPSKEVLF